MQHLRLTFVENFAKINFGNDKNMAYVDGGKHFGQYTYEHWFDHEYGNKMDMIIDELKTSEINFVSNLINNVFNEFVGKDYSERGNNTFKEYIMAKNILSRLNDKSSQFFTAKCKNEIIGIMEIKKYDHISLFFVKKEFHRKGIGKKLFKYFIERIRNEKSGIKSITVNSSFFAETIYTKLGFTKTNEMQEKDGIKFIPMEYKL